MSELAAIERTLAPDSQLVERFRRELDALIVSDQRIGVAVSGGPDSLALLLLASAARPGMVEAATVDHALREGSRAEAEMVGSLCAELAVPHTILTVGWAEKPATAIQERARIARYRLLGRWIEERKLAALLTGHHMDDQAETMLMRLARGAGVRGLAAMRRVVRATGSDTALVRPLLGWRRSELEQICVRARLEPAADPSNEDDKFERVRVRKALAETEWLDPQAVSISARNLAQADAALAWATTQEWERTVSEADGEIVYQPEGAPLEIRRRIVRRAVLKLAHEGRGAELRGPELNRLLAALASGRRATLRGVLCIGGEEWRFTPAPKRRLH